jgi:hypothetical protein
VPSELHANGPSVAAACLLSPLVINRKDAKIVITSLVSRVAEWVIMAGADGDTDLGVRLGWRWDVALSFAGAQRRYVEQVAEALKARGVRCFYDADEQIDLWGKYLAEELPIIYGEQAAAVVVFVSAEYVARDWTVHERRAALGRAVRERRQYVLPARFDDTPLPGLPPDVSYVDLRTKTPQQFATMIADKLAALAISSRSTEVEDAVRLRRQVLADTTRVLGSDHSTTLQRRGDLVLELVNTGPHNEAVELASTLLSDRARVLGADHLTTIDTRALLAYCFLTAGQPQEAARLRRQVLADTSRILGSDHLTTLGRRDELVRDLVAAGAYEEATDMARALLTDHMRILGPDHLSTINARERHAWCLTQQNGH